MRKIALVILLLVLFSIPLVACSAKSIDPASMAVEAYLEALVNKDSARFSTLYCASWESQAHLEFDSLQAVKARLNGLSCKNTGNLNGSFQVICQGKIIATYNNEDQSLDLSSRTYQVVQQNGDYLVCGLN